MRLRFAALVYLIAVFSIDAVLSIETAAKTAVEPDSSEFASPGTVSNQTTDSARAGAAGVAEAFQSGITRTPPLAEAWMRSADFDLERFRILELKLRSSQSGMAVVLRLQAEGLYSGPETREELLRQSATADPEQQGIWGELGVEQVRRGMLHEAAATLKTAQERQPQDLRTLRLEAMIAAARGEWKQAEEHLQELGSRSSAMLREEMQSWPRNLLPHENVAGRIWNCVRDDSASCTGKTKVPANEVRDSEEQLFDEQRWEQLAALREPLPEVPAAWFRRGVALAQIRDCTRAIPGLERGLDAGAETAAYWLELCYASEAERSIARLGKLGNQAAFHRVRGDFLVRVKGDMQAATEEYVKARKLQPRDPLLAERLAQAYENTGDIQLAKKAARDALALEPRRAVSLRLLASIAMNERDYANALECLNKLLAIQPNVAWTRVQLGIAYAQTGQPQEALANLQLALAASYPDERGALHAMLASVLRKLGREQEAQSATAESDRLSNLFQQHGSKTVDDHQ